jgi:hypothetical protein
MKYIIFIFFLIFTPGNSQNLFEYKVDGYLKLSLPKENIKIDTLNCKMIVSAISNGKLIILKASNNPEIIIHNKKELLKSYKAFHRGVIKRLKGEFINEETIKFNEILVDRLNFKSNQNSVIQQIESYAFYLENIYYDFQFWHPENEDEEYKKYKEQILTSISFESNLTIKNQFTKN